MTSPNIATSRSLSGPNPGCSQDVRRYLSAERVRAAAAVHGFKSVAALARAAGVTAPHLGSCLAGRYTAGPRLIDGLLRALPGADVDDISQLCTVTEIRTPVSPTTRNPSACDAGHTAAR